MPVRPTSSGPQETFVAQSNYLPQAVATTGPCSGTLTTDAAITTAASNPNFATHRVIWQNQRRLLGEDTKDWAEFRAHEQRIYSYDPGVTASREFCAYSASGGGGTPPELGQFLEFLKKNKGLAIAGVAGAVLLYLNSSK